MMLQRRHGSVGIIGAGRQQHCPLSTGQFAVLPVEPVDDGFELGRHPIVIERRHEGNHVRLQQVGHQRLHAVLLDAGAGPAAGVTGQAGLHPLPSRVKAEHRMARLLGPTAERRGQRIRRPLSMGTAGNGYNFHGCVLRFRMTGSPSKRSFPFRTATGLPSIRFS